MLFDFKLQSDQSQSTMAKAAGSVFGSLLVLAISTKFKIIRKIFPELSFSVLIFGYDQPKYFFLHLAKWCVALTRRLFSFISASCV